MDIIEGLVTEKMAYFPTPGSHNRLLIFLQAYLSCTPFDGTLQL